ncbi:MAG: large subunit ribosomal protein [Thermoleophilaceae bacterium]|jgi:large subunit ribosomal protein L4|nr:large subunit ribosomal protein [Thermoleophilaceae bacterium]
MAKKTAPYIGKTGKVDLDEKVFGEEFNMGLVHETARAELNARRRGTASTLTRGEVSMTTAKAFRQKGTGRARAGALSTPNRYGGGVAFGPSPRSYVVKVNRKARKKALRAALSVHADRGSLSVCDPSTYETPSTKAAAEALGDITGRILVVVGAEDATCAKSFRNIKGVSVHACDNVGVADLIGATRLIVTPTALEHLTGVAS